MFIRVLISSLACLPGLLAAESNHYESNSNQVTFDIDKSREGLDFLNIDDVNIQSKAGSGAALTGIGASSTVEVKSRADNIPLVLRPIFVPVFLLRDMAKPTLSLAMLPVVNVTRAETPPELNPKFLSNHPTGRPGDASSPMNRQLFSDRLEKFKPEDQKTLQEMVKHDQSLTASAFSLPKFSAYETDLPEKQNTNRPTTRTGRGRGNSRELFPATPNAP